MTGRGLCSSPRRAPAFTATIRWCRWSSHLRPALVFLLYDISFQPVYWAHLRRASWRPPVVMYTPVEAGPIAPEIIEPLEGVARYVMYNEFGRGVIADSLAAIRARRPDFGFPPLDVIAHGVDQDHFFRYQHRRWLRQRSGRVASPRGSNWVLIRRRRAVPSSCSTPIATCRASGLISPCRASRSSRATNQPTSNSICMATEDSGWNVLLLAKRYGIFDRLIATRADNQRPAFDDAAMNALYNACDVGLTTSTSGAGAWSPLSMAPPCGAGDAAAHLARRVVGWCGRIH